MRYTFDDFLLDLRTFELLHDGERVQMEPQVFDVLAYLVQHHDRLVTKDELIEHIWPERFISEAALSSRLMAARKALGDSGRTQRFIRTAHGRGFQFVAPVQVLDGEQAAPPSELEAAPEPVPPLHVEAPIGREREVAELLANYEAATAGHRRVVFLTGEPGLGKTTLVTHFARGLEGSGTCVGFGQCVEHRAADAAYLPVFEALKRMGQGGRLPDLAAMVTRYAPAWAIQMPAIVPREEAEVLQPLVAGNTAERMLREALDLLEAISERCPVVLVLEDLHWADPSTIDLVGGIARRANPARLLVVGTYRPRDLSSTGHPLAELASELVFRDLAVEIPIDPFDRETTEIFLGQRFPGADFPPEVAGHLHTRTAGNPLFMSTVADGWVSRGMVTGGDMRWTLEAPPGDLARDVPDTLRQLIAMQTRALPDEDRAIAEAAAVEGVETCSAAVAAALGIDEDEAEERCGALARSGRLLQELGVEAWPDGTISTRIGFLHPLYREVNYEECLPGRRARMHLRIGERLAAAHGEGEGAIAARVAGHFEAAMATDRAVPWLAAAARTAIQMGAFREAKDSLDRALHFFESLPPERRDVALEVDLHTNFAVAAVATEGFGSDRAAAAFERAIELGEETGNSMAAMSPLFGLAALNEYRGHHAECKELLEQIALARLPEAPALETPYQSLLSCSYFHQGQFDAAVSAGDRGLEHWQPELTDLRYAVLGEDPGLGCSEWSSLSLWFLGYPDRAAARVEQMLLDAETKERYYAIASARTQAERVHQFRREPAIVATHAMETMAMAGEQGYMYHYAVARLMFGWANAVLGNTDEGLAALSQGLDAHAATGAHMDRPYFLGLLADAHRVASQLPAALETINHALDLITEERPFFYHADLVRQRANLRLAIGGPRARDAAVAELQQALAVAREQGALSLELRAARDLAALLREDGDGQAARGVLKPLYGRFSEGFDTADLVEAKELLDSLPA